ncbi:MAG: DUF2325 domain-containing protein [Clostridia bacterium]|nr:DUF2325 domain-containing protein [Clostridia bacterium]
MSVVIVGGHECMTREYIDLCRQYKCKAKVYPKMKRSLKDFGSPDLIVLFTNTISHKMVHCVMSEIKGQDIPIARSHSSSISALKGILSEHAMG